MLDLIVKKLSDTAKTPTRAHSTDAGADIYSDEYKVIPPFSTRTVKTNICVAIPNSVTFNIPSLPDFQQSGYVNFNWELQVRSKSGLSKNHGIVVLNSPGTIDHGYTGEITVILYNSFSDEYIVKPQQKIAQLILAPVICSEFKVVDNDEFDQATFARTRKDNGFGSSGLI